MVMLAACTVPSESVLAPAAALSPVELNTRFVNPPTSVPSGARPRIEYRNDYNAVCQLTAYDWQTGYWSGNWKFPNGQGGAVHIGTLTKDTYLHLDCKSPVYPASTGFAVHLIRVQ